MKGKFLIYKESFCWNDKNFNRSILLNNYNDALQEARNIGDHVFCPNAIYFPENRDIIFQFMWLNGYQSYDQLKVHFKWLQVDDFQLLQTISYNMGKSTPSNNWEEFANEFEGENKSLIGLKDDTCLHPLVHDKNTHKEFHSNFVKTFDLATQKAHYKYFKKHYKPSLKTDSGSIQSLIQKKRVNTQIIRLDPPSTSPDGKPIHGQQVHIHIKIKNKNCALNIDGTWKHPPTNLTDDKIPADICLTISQWGFCLPEDYY